MFRAAIAADTQLGRKVKPIYDAGRLVPDELTIDLIRDRLSQPDARAGFILDGFPRNLPQAEALDELLLELGRPLDVVFDFQIDDELAKERMLGRAKEEARSDDTPEAIAERLRIYHEQTEPLVQHYLASGRVVGIHAERSIDEVWSELQDALDQAEGEAA
jgi:adenylate kinase